MTFIPLNTTNKFKDKQGRYLTKGLFKETCDLKHIKPIYTLSDEPKEGFISAREVYMNANDPSEYQVAIDMVGSWEHWKRLCECDWFMECVTRWREELELKLRSNALRSIVNQSLKEGKEAVSAAKYIVEGGWKGSQNKRGRPSKDEIKREARIQAELGGELEETMRRLGIQ